MAACDGLTRRARVLAWGLAALLAVGGKWGTPLGGAAIEDVGQTTPWEQVGNSSGKAHHPRPYKPSGIVDPFSDVTCNAKDEKCSTYSSCENFPYRLCLYYEHCKQKECLHKQLFPMLDGDLALFVVMFLIAVCAGAAGIGGGGLNVPILMMISSFGIKEAVPLSHAAVMGNAFAQLLVNAPQRHPDCPSRPLIHYELAILALPAQLGGNSLGVVVGRIFPPTILIVLSLAMLILAATKTGMKARETLKKHQQSKRALIAPIAPQQTLSLPLASPSTASPNRERWAASGADRSPSMDKDMNLPTSTADNLECVRTWSGTNLVMPRGSSADAQVLVPARRASGDTNPPSGGQPNQGNGAAVAEAPVPVRIPWKVISTMVGFNLIFCVDFLVMSPEVFKVEKCTTIYWIALIGLYPFVVASIWIGIKSMKSLAAYHENRNDPPIPGDPEVTMRLVTLFPLASVVIGLIAGLVGLGGGEFMVPLLLEFGLQPRVATATSGFLILFSTSSNIVHYLVANMMQPFIQYGAGVFILAFFGALTGLCIRDTKFLMERNYLLVFLLTGLLIISAGLLAYRGFGIATLDWGFKSFCDG